MRPDTSNTIVDEERAARDRLGTTAAGRGLAPTTEQPQSVPTFTEQLARTERARRARLRTLWQMTLAERIGAMRRGELTIEQLAAWTGRHPEQVPRVNGEFEWIAARTPEACE